MNLDLKLAIYIKTYPNYSECFKKHGWQLQSFAGGHNRQFQLLSYDSHANEGGKFECSILAAYYDEKSHASEVK